MSDCLWHSCPNAAAQGALLCTEHQMKVEVAAGLGGPAVPAAEAGADTYCEVPGCMGLGARPYTIPTALMPSGRVPWLMGKQAMFLCAAHAFYFECMQAFDTRTSIGLKLANDTLTQTAQARVLSLVSLVWSVMAVVAVAVALIKEAPR